MTPPTFESIPRVAEVTLHRGASAPPDAVPDLLLEVPHGATRAEHFDELAGELAGPFPDDLRSFFFVNTDVGAPEVADALAKRVVEGDPARTVRVIRCLVPRTFIDCNRVIAPDARPKASGAGDVTPGLAPYVQESQDQELLLDRYARYRDLVERAVDAVCDAGGTVLMPHSYAPREVDVPVDDRIVERLHEAYEPDRVETWPLRPAVDLITRTPEGEMLASEPLRDAVRDAFEYDGFEVAEERCYPLHPATMAHHYASRHPGRTLCFEMRRDLLVPEFTPFSEMRGDPTKVNRMAGILTRAVVANGQARNY